MPAWDPGLPQSPLLDGYDETPPDLAIKSQPDTGPKKSRKRYTAGVRAIKWPFRMSTTQIALLDTFFLTTLDGGVTAFTHADPRTGITESYKFSKPPTYVRSGLNWSVLCDLEIQP